MGCSTSAVARDSSTQLDVLKDFHDKYALGLKIGRGAFAQVRIAKDVDSKMSAPQEKAVKIIDIADKAHPSEACRQLEMAVHHESTIWATIGSHPNCVKLYDVYFGATLCYLVMEKCSSSLLQHIEQMTAITERQVGQLFLQMLSGMAHVHSRSVIHRDIKPDNFLVGEDGVTVKLCDFGLSTTNTGKLGVNGTAPFMCPEMLKGKNYDEKSDIWSLGVCAYALLFGTFPYIPNAPNSKEMKLAIVEGKTPTFKPVGRPSPQGAHFRTEVAMTFVKTLLARDPTKRPSAVEASQLEYMAAVEENRHAPEATLPSLRQMINSAKKVGAFEARSPSKEDNIDEILNRLQVERHGVAIPLPDNKRRPMEITPSRSVTKSNKANAWEEDISHLSTCASTASPSASTPQTASESSISFASGSFNYQGSGWSTGPDQIKQMTL